LQQQGQCWKWKQILKAHTATMAPASVVKQLLLAALLLAVIPALLRQSRVAEAQQHR
jgi:hypothetical protein